LLPPALVIERRVHPRARRLKLTLRDGRVWLTCPPRAPEADVQRFLRSSDAWLTQQWTAYWTQQHLSTIADGTVNPAMSTGDAALENSLRIALLGQQWVIQQDASIKAVLAYQGVLSVPKLQAAACLKAWVLEQAKLHLPLRLAQLAAQHGLVYQHCTVRHARTRWGSCSAQQRINLNAALLLLPVELLDYVLLHELCHTRQMNHSAAFWHEVSAVCPDWRAHKTQLAAFRLPMWWNTTVKPT
jgi:predicted metal-dependent hydrolase